MKKYGRHPSRIVIRVWKYRSKLWNDMDNMEERQVEQWKDMKNMEETQVE